MLNFSCFFNISIEYVKIMLKISAKLQDKLLHLI